MSRGVAAVVVALGLASPGGEVARVGSRDDIAIKVYAAGTPTITCHHLGEPEYGACLHRFAELAVEAADVMATVLDERTAKR